MFPNSEGLHDSTSMIEILIKGSRSEETVHSYMGIDYVMIYIAQLLLLIFR